MNKMLGMAFLAAMAVVLTLISSAAIAADANAVREGKEVYLIEALEGAGVVFVDEADGGPGVYLPKGKRR